MASALEREELLFGFSQSTFIATILWLKPIAFLLLPKAKDLGYVNVRFVYPNFHFTNPHKTFNLPT